MDAKRIIKRAAVRCRVSVGWHIDHWLLGPMTPYLAERRWKKAMRDPHFTGISDRKRKQPLIVSLTSFPARIDCTVEAVKTLLTQTLKPDKVILFLAEEEFPGREAELPENLAALVRYGLSIQWCGNYRSFKKLVPALLAFPEACIITADDDLLYHPDMVKRLYAAYQRDGRSANFIYCHRITKVAMSDETIDLSVGGYDIYRHPSYLNMGTSGSGILFPPHTLDADVTKHELFMRLAPSNDDVWFWLMAVKAGTRTRAVKRRITKLPLVPGSQDVSLVTVNRVDQGDGENLTVKQMRAVLEHYPEVRERLKEEWKREEPWI